MADGAHLGFGAEDSMKAAIGGAEPAESMTAQEMKDQILASEMSEGFDYNGAAMYTAKLVLLWLEEDPTRAQTPSENTYDEDYQVVTSGWYEQIKEANDDLAEMGLTGFMWGWAVNAARRCLELPPVPNPAIMTIGVSDA